MQRSEVARYGVAVVAAGAAAIVTTSEPELREHIPFIIPFGAVTASALLGGFGPGLVAVVVAIGLLGPIAFDHPVRMILFAILGSVVSYAAEKQRGWRIERERLREESEKAERRFAFLAEASTVLSASLDSDVTLGTVARLAVPYLADWCTVDLVQADGSVRRVAFAHGNPAKAELVRGAEVYPPDPDGRHPRTRVLRTGRSELFPELTAADLEIAASNPEQLRVMKAVGYRSAMIVPLLAHGQILGALTLATADSRRYGATELALAEDLARRAALAIDNARLYGDAQQALAQAEAASRAKDEFLSVVSHELRTPLASALLWARMLARGGLDRDKIARAAETIERSMRRQARLVEDLLDASRIVTGTFHLDRRPVDLVVSIDAAVRGLAATAAEKQVEIVWLRGPAASVLGDRKRLEQIVGNLLQNAIEFTPATGRVEVSVMQESGRVQIFVSDTGEGIAADLLPHVFERFRQGDSTSTRAHGGLGLGLAIVRELVALHDGTVRAESAGPGRGATFVVDLPLAAAAAQAS